MEACVPVTVSLAGSLVPSETRVVSAAAQVLVITTSLATPLAPYTLHSSYVGERDQPTAVTHLLLAPGDDPALSQHQHAAHLLPVADDERRLCLYDHLQLLLGALVDAGFDPGIEVADRSVAIVDQ